MQSVLVPVADGSEEMEAVIIIDTLRRSGLDVTVAAIGQCNTVTASRGVRLVADVGWDDIKPDVFDALVLPGGAGGTDVMIATPSLLEALRQFHTAGKLVAAICAAPLALQAAGIVGGRKMTCHPAVADSLVQPTHSGDRVVQDGNLITSQGPGTAFEFALCIVSALLGADAADAITPGLILP
jgi:DJ-1 family protein